MSASWHGKRWANLEADCAIGRLLTLLGFQKFSTFGWRYVGGRA